MDTCFHRVQVLDATPGEGLYNLILRTNNVGLRVLHVGSFIAQSPKFSSRVESMLCLPQSRYSARSNEYGVRSIVDLGSIVGQFILQIALTSIAYIDRRLDPD